MGCWNRFFPRIVLNPAQARHRTNMRSWSPHIDLPERWHTSTVRGRRRLQHSPLQLVPPKRADYPCSHCSPCGQPASVLLQGVLLATRPMLLLIRSSHGICSIYRGPVVSALSFLTYVSTDLLSKNAYILLLLVWDALIL